MKKWLLFAAMAGLVVGCSKEDPPPPEPGPVTLVFPENNSLCIEGVSQSETKSEVTFRWEAASNADAYEVRVSALNTTVTQRQITSGQRLSLLLDKGAPYSWQVTAINERSGAETSSAEWRFYNAGASLSYPPFPALLLEPASGASVLPDGTGGVLLRWDPADPDSDLEQCEVYLGTDPADLPRLAVLDLLEGPADRFLAPVERGTVYYWQVLSRDAQGNTSRSALFSFRVL